MSRRGSILFYVQHLLGIGHVKRAACLARALSQAGFGVTLVSGGMPVPGLDAGDATLVQLPPIRSADASFSRLVDEMGEPALAPVFTARRIRLLEALEAADPDIVITEHFPFGRRKLQGEILGLLDICRARPHRPVVMASVRDILVTPKDPQQCADWVETYYDAVLVHGDPSIVPFEASFPLTKRIASKIHYTGYVAEPGPAPASDNDRFEIVVSAGGGTEARSLLDATLAARALTSVRNGPWRVLLGLNATTAEREAIRAMAGPGVAVEAFRGDLPELLSKARVSVSRAGYNTMAETLASGTRMVVVPFETERETEQGERAARFAACGLCQMVSQDDLSPENLAQTIDAALKSPLPDRTRIRLDGAQATATLLSQWITQAEGARSA